MSIGGCANQVKNHTGVLRAGSDGCVCVYDCERSYLPTTFILAGFPLHATAMAASQDGKLLAVAALAECSPGGASAGSGGRGRPATTGCSSGGSSSASGPEQPAIILYNLVTMQPLLQLPVAGHSRVAQLQLLPDSRHVLAVTAAGRLLAYGCADGSLALDVPRCLSDEVCTAAALDPSGSFLVAGSAGGPLKVFGLNALQQLAQPGEAAPCGAAAVISCLPCQDLCPPAGSAVLDAVFAGNSNSPQLLTVGQQGEVCCWSFHGQPASAAAAASNAMAAAAIEPGGAAVSVAAQGPQQASGAAGRPMIHLNVDCTSAAPSAPRAPSCQLGPVPGHSGAATVRPDNPAEQPGPEVQLAYASLESPAPRPLPLVLQNLPPRPPSAPAALPKQPPAHVALPQAALRVRRQQSASLPGSPMRGSHREPPFWEQPPRAPEASLLITATHSQRCTKVVRQQKQLRITSPCKVPGIGAAKQPHRTAAWVEEGVATDRIPPYRPSQQLQLLPPSAAVRHVLGMEASAGFCWQPAGPEPQQQQLVYAAGNTLLSWDLSGRQRQVARLPRQVSALAVHGGLAAAAVQPAPGDGSTADIHLVEVQSGAVRCVLSHHSYAVKVRTAACLVSPQLVV